MAVDYLSSLKIGSGLNTTQIIDSIVEAERAPKAALIDSSKDQKTVEISGLGTVKQDFNKLNTKINLLSGSTGLKTEQVGTSSNISITDSTKAKAFSHQIEISTLAKAHTLVFSGFANETAAVGTGSINFEFGTWSGGAFSANSTQTSKQITIASTNNTLTGLRDEINSANMGVTASILKTGTSSFSLMLKSIEGAANALRLKTTEDPTSSGLSSISYTSVNSSIETVAASNASFSIDGTDITRTENTITDLIDGVTLTLKSATSAAETIGAIYDNSVAQTAIESIVSEINTLQTSLTTLSQRGLNGAEAGPLAGDPLIRTLQNRIKSYTTTALSGFGTSNKYLAEFGVKTEKDGSLTFNATDFKKAFDRDPDSFSAMTNTRATTPSSSIAASIVGANFTPGIYTFKISETGSATLSNNSKVKNASFVVSENATPSAGEVNALKLTAGTSSIEFAAKTDGTSAGNTAAAIKAAFDDLKDKKGFAASIANNLVTFTRTDGQNLTVQKSANTYKGIEVKAHTTVNDGAVRTVTLGLGTSDELALQTTNTNTGATMLDELQTAFNALTETAQKGYKIARTSDAIQFYRLDGTTFTIHSDSDDLTHDAGNNTSAAQFTALAQGTVAVSYKNGGTAAEGNETIQIDLVGAASGTTDDLTFTSAALAAGDDTEIVTAIKTAFDALTDKKGYLATVANNAITFTRSDGVDFTFEATETGTVGSSAITLQASLDGASVADLTSGTATSATSAGNQSAAAVSISSATTLASNLKENISTGGAVINTTPKTTIEASGHSTIQTMTKVGNQYSLNTGDGNGLRLEVKNASFVVSENATPSAGEVNALKLTAGTSSIEFAAKTDGTSAGNTAAAIKAAFDDLKDKKGFAASIANNLVTFTRTDGQNLTVQKSANTYKGIEVKAHTTVNDGAVRTVTLGLGTSDELALQTTNTNTGATMLDELQTAFNALTETAQKGYKIARTSDAIQFYRLDGTTFTIHSDSDDLTHDAGNNTSAAQFTALAQGTVAVSYKNGGTAAEGNETIQIDLVGAASGTTDDLTFTSAALAAGDDTEIVTAIKTAFDALTDKKGYLATVANNAITFTRSDGVDFTFEATETGTVGSSAITLQASLDGASVADLTSGTATSATSAGNQSAAAVSISSATTLASNLKENISTGGAVINTTPKTTTTVGTGQNTSVYLGKSLISGLTSFAQNITSSSGDLESKLTKYNDDLTDLTEDMTKLDKRIEIIRARYVTQFSAMDKAVAGLKNTETYLDNMMESWRAALKQ